MRMTPANMAVTVLLVGVSFAGGAWWNHQPGPASTATNTPAVQQYTCPMHPEYRSDRPGDCPSCGMKLELVKPASSAAPAMSGSDGMAMPDMIEVSAERQQTIGVRFGTAEQVSGHRILRTTGRVAAKESATYQVVAGASGWIRAVMVTTPGTQVTKDQILAEFYSPDLISAEQQYFALVDAAERSGRDVGVAANLQRSANTLRNMGVSDLQLEEMKRDRDFSQNIHVLSPATGVVLQRNISTGLRFDRGFEFYQVADLSSVWIIADLSAVQADQIRPGTSVRVSLPQRGRELQARVSQTQPLFDDATRTLKVRLDAANPGAALTPGMSVDVDFPLNLPAGLAVPADAIVDTGLRKTLFVDRGNGFFEARQVETGWRIGDQIQVTQGLSAGERIVISGTFLIDSESRMKAAKRR